MICKVTIEFHVEQVASSDDACDEITKKLEEAGIEFESITVEELLAKRPELN